jgi:hypothetical protein
MSKGGEFKGDRPELGYRLGEQRGAGLLAIQRRYAPVEPARVVRPEGDRSFRRKDAAVVVRRSGPQGGRPKVEGVRPWEAAGVSKATWFRRKREAGSAGE